MEGEQARPGTWLVGRAPVTLQLPSRYPDLILEVRLGALMTPHEPRTIPEACQGTPTALPLPRPQSRTLSLVPLLLEQSPRPRQPLTLSPKISRSSLAIAAS